MGHTTVLDCRDLGGVTPEVPPQHLWICCGFGQLPSSLHGTFALDGDSADDPACLEIWGSGEHAFSLYRRPCAYGYYAPDLPFHAGAPDPPICLESPFGPNDNISRWGFSPGGVYDGGNGCHKDPETGEITFNMCASNVGSPCTFRVCATI